MDIASNISPLLVGGASGMGILGLFALLFRLLFSREAKEYARLEARIVLLEATLKAETSAHMECVRKMGVLEGRVEQLTADINEVIERHDRRNLQHNKGLEIGIQKLEEKIEGKTA